MSITKRMFGIDEPIESYEEDCVLPDDEMETE